MINKVTYFFSNYLGFSKESLMVWVYTILAIVLYIIIKNILQIFISKRVKEVGRQYFLTKLSGYLSGLVFLLFLFKIWFGGIQGIVAYIGIASAGLAIALQDPLTNLAGWFFIALRKPFIVGDRIQIDNFQGDVIDIRLFQFSLIEIGNWVDADQSTGRIIHVPNGWIFKYFQANYTEGFNFIWNEIEVTITFESDWKKAREILTRIAQKHTVIKSEKAAEQVKNAAKKYMILFKHLTPIVWLKVKESGVDLTIRYLCEPRQRRSSSSIIWEDILEAFSKESHINFAYPTTRFYNHLEESSSFNPNHCSSLDRKSNDKVNKS